MIRILGGGPHVRSSDSAKYWIENQKPSHKMWFFWQGEGTFSARQIVTKVCPGLFICLPPETNYRLSWAEDVTLGYYSIRFTIDPAPGLWPLLVRVHDVAFIENAIRRVVELRIESESDESEAARLANELLRIALVDIQRQSPGTREGAAKELRRRVITQAAMRISRDPVAGQDIKAIAKQAGYTRQHFTRLFREVMGVTPKRYALMCRINHAWEMLQTTSLSIKEIALRLGFHSSHHFAAQFKRETGLVPSDSRRAHPVSSI